MERSQYWMRRPPRQAAEVAGLVLTWLLVAVLCLTVLDLARLFGVPVVLLVLVWTGSSMARRRHRPARDGHPIAPQPGSLGDHAPSSAASPGPWQGTTQDGAPVTDRGNPYDLETYLKRKGEEEA